MKDDLLALKRVLGDGNARLARGCAHGEAVLLPGGSLGIGGMPFPDLNWGDVYGSGASEAFAAFAGHVRRRGLPGILTVPVGRAAEIAPVARELGLGEPEDEYPFMVCRREAATPPARDYPCRRLTTAEDLDVLCDILSEAFEIPRDILSEGVGPEFLETPDVAFFVAELDGAPAAIAGTVRVGEAAGVFSVATRVALRRRGAAAAVLWTAMRRELDRGATAFALHASDLGAPLYEGLGYATEARVAVWQVPAPAEG